MVDRVSWIFIQSLCVILIHGVEIRRNSVPYVPGKDN